MKPDGRLIGEYPISRAAIAGRAASAPGRMADCCITAFDAGLIGESFRKKLARAEKTQ